MQHARYLDRPARPLSEIFELRRVDASQGVDYMTLAEAHDQLKDMLEAHLLPGKIGWPHPHDVTITARLTPRQWMRALHVTQFCAADLVDRALLPEGFDPQRSRRYLNINWRRDPALPGFGTARATCELRARAGGKEFVVEILVDDTAAISA